MNFITKNDIDQLIPLSGNLDARRIELYSIEQQKIKCTQFLGSALYSELMANYTDKSGKWFDLLNHVKPMLVYWTYAMYLQRGNVFNTATGPVVKRTDSSFPMSDYEHRTLLDSICNNARFYESELQAFLIENADDYPDFISGKKHTGCNRFKISTNNTNELV
jgi:hypothetical protein